MKSGLYCSQSIQILIVRIDFIVCENEIFSKRNSFEFLAKHGFNFLFYVLFFV